MYEDIAIVLTIFDGYEDLWDDCIRFIEIFWPDHPHIYVITNEIVKTWPNVYCYPAGKDAEWSKKVQKAADIVTEKYVILLLEDFYIGAPVNNIKLQTLIKFIKDNNLKYCKLCDNNRAFKPLKKHYDNSRYFVIYADEAYGVNLQASIWDKDYLIDTVGKENYNAWVFELNQLNETYNKPHKRLEFAIEDMSNILNIRHGALQGKMLPNTVRYFKRIGCPLSSDREVMSSILYFLCYLKFLGRQVIPGFAKKTIKSVARRLGYEFVSDKWTEKTTNK